MSEEEQKAPPGPYSEEDHELIKKYVHAQWWMRLRQMKKMGMKLGRRKDRHRRIKEQAAKLFEDFKEMSRQEQRAMRISMAGAVEEFKNIDNPTDTGRVSCAS